MTLSWMSLEDLFHGEPGLDRARAALASGQRGRMIRALDRIGLLDRDHAIDEEDRMLALRAALLGPEATGAEGEAWRGSRTRTAAMACPVPAAAGLLRAVRSWAEDRDPPLWVYGAIRPGAGHLIARADAGSVLLLAREELDFEDRRGDG